MNDCTKEKEGERERERERKREIVDPIASPGFKHDQICTSNR